MTENQRPATHYPKLATTSRDAWRVMSTGLWVIGFRYSVSTAGFLTRTRPVRGRIDLRHRHGHVPGDAHASVLDHDGSIPDDHVDLRNVVQRDVRPTVHDQHVRELANRQRAELVAHVEKLGVLSRGDREDLGRSEPRLMESLHLEQVGSWHIPEPVKHQI